MINRLTYEVRLMRTNSHRPKRWRWDVDYLSTTDPEFPGVETGRSHLGHKWGYSRFKWIAMRNISKNVIDNPYKKIWTER